MGCHGPREFHNPDVSNRASAYAPIDASGTSPSRNTKREVESLPLISGATFAGPGLGF
jgi:hypothetical protein